MFGLVERIVMMNIVNAFRINAWGVVGFVFAYSVAFAISVVVASQQNILQKNENGMRSIRE